MKPLVRWVGGKRSISSFISPIIDDYLSYSEGRYYEPFLGGGAVAFSLKAYTERILSDSCLPLINLYSCVQEDPDKVHLALCMYREKCTKEEYIKIRKNPPLDRFQLAGWFLYVMSLSFNGIWRLNKRGHFNVPYNNKGLNAVVPSKNDLVEFCENIRNRTAFVCTDYSIMIDKVRFGDFLFIDSPYHGTFSDYSVMGFSDQDHINLANHLRKAVNRGADFIATNSDTKEVRELYSFAHILSIKERRAINSDSEGRKSVDCLLITSSKEIYEKLRA